MINNSASEIKKTGATFTPRQLAEFLSDKLVNFAGNIPGEVVILDPACGDGALLSAIKERINDHELNIIGYDTNKDYLAVSQASLQNDGGSAKVELNCQDFLTVCPNIVDLFNTETRTEFADIVIANPPYVRTQVLGAEKAQQLARDFGLSGKIDLYYPFLMAMTNALKKGGILGVITSNRYLSTKSGGDIRKYLLDNYDILEVIDLGDTKLFDAAVLPAIFIGRKKTSKSAISSVGKYVSIYEQEKDAKIHSLVTAESIYNILKNDVPGIYMVGQQEYVYKSGLLKHSANRTDVWQMSNEQENCWIDTINNHTSFRIKDKFKVRVGVKSCADSVFISQLWENEGYEIEPLLLKPMISQENIETWRIDRSTMQEILYPHYAENGKRIAYDIKDFPIAEAYLAAHKDQLAGREYVIKAGRKWYEYWVPQNPAFWNLPKVVFPDISVRPRFCFDDSGAVVNGNCYWLCAQTEEEKELLFLIEGVSNSEVMIKYHDLCFNNKLYSGRRRYLTQYIEQYPMPDAKSEEAQGIIKRVKEINSTTDENRVKELSQEINTLVEMAFGLKD